MNLATKKRLVGTIVLGSLALIIIPLLLDGEGMETLPITTTIPPAPVIDTTPIPDPVRPVIVADNPANDATPENTASDNITDDDATAGNNATDNNTDNAGVGAQHAAPEIPDQPQAESPPELAETQVPDPVADEDNAAPSPNTAASTQPQLDERGLPEAWTVRLGSFANKTNADALLGRLLAADYKAYQRPVQSNGRSLSGVFVGPVLTRREADALQAELIMSFQLKGLVMQFELEP